MRNVVRVLAVCSLLVAPFGSSAYAAPVLSAATLTYDDQDPDWGALNVASLPFLVPSGGQYTFCGAGDGCDDDATFSADGILLTGDFVRFTGTSIVFDFFGNGDPLAQAGYRDLGFHSSATFIMDLTGFTESGALAGVSVSSTVNVLGASSAVSRANNVISFVIGTIGIGTDANGEPQRGQVTLNLDIRNSTQPPDPMPEPSTLMLLGAGLVAAAGARRRRSSR